MKFIYNSLIYLAEIVLSIVAIFNKKMALFINGRKNTFEQLQSLKGTKKLFWFHVASLGEFEQGRPIIEEIKKQFPNYKILVTFFSPSGYEVQKDYNQADLVCYLPLDKKKNAVRFLKILQPSFAIFVKYEFWPNFLNELNKQQIPTLLISGIFRKKQLFFKPYGAWMRKSLDAFEHFFVQDKNSQQLLNSININNVSICGDTRFDRVFEILQQVNHLDFIEQFKNNQYTLVAGSTWKEDEDLLIDYINNVSKKDEKIIIAPHNIHPKKIVKLKSSLKANTVLFSEKKGKDLSNYQVFIIDTIGILTKIYASANAVYVGGGLTKNGVHNVLEPATFGSPIVIGPHYKKYKEVVDLVQLKGCSVIRNSGEFSAIFANLKNNEQLRVTQGKINRTYIENNLGATQMIFNYIKKQLT